MEENSRCEEAQNDESLSTAENKRTTAAADQEKNKKPIEDNQKTVESTCKLYSNAMAHTVFRSRSSSKVHPLELLWPKLHQN